MFKKNRFKEVKAMEHSREVAWLRGAGGIFIFFLPWQCLPLSRFWAPQPKTAQVHYGMENTDPSFNGQVGGNESYLMGWGWETRTRKKLKLSLNWFKMATPVFCQAPKDQIKLRDTFMSSVTTMDMTVEATSAPQTCLGVLIKACTSFTFTSLATLAGQFIVQLLLPFVAQSEGTHA